MSKTTAPTGPIDIVIPWVDGDDPAWRAQRSLYRADSNADGSDARYRDWDIFRYWFRGVEENAPWVRTIHLITWGHLPAWLNTDHPKLHIVRHEDYIPREYLPTFSSHTIELNLHRIPGLSEQFLYFNDDVYLTSPAEPSDFFRGGQPVDTAVFGIVKNSDTSNFMPYIMLNMLGIINMHFSKRSMLKRDFFKWFTLKNGKGVLNTAYLSPWGLYTGFRNYHSCSAFLKSTFEEVWKTVPRELDQTCHHKFRSKEDVNQYLMRYWQLCSGRFVPHKPNSAYITIGRGTSALAEELLKSPRYKIVCINDDPMDFSFDEEQAKLRAVFERAFPTPSSFEINIGEAE